jgi:hypothetical protein
MNSKIKNIIIGVVVIAVLVLVYIFFIKKSSTETGLTSSSGDSVVAEVPGASSTNAEEVGKDFITVLLSVKSINLDDSIFKDKAFMSLNDSSITLIQVGDEGRPNPFAPIGSESESLLPNTTPTPEGVPPVGGSGNGVSGGVSN